MIVVCHKCHSALTPHNLLTKRGIENARTTTPFARLYEEFYRVLDKLNGNFDTIDVLDLFDELTNKYCMRFYGEKANNKEMRI